MEAARTFVARDPMSFPDLFRIGRFRPLAWLACCFVAISTLTRLVLLATTGAGVPRMPGVRSAASISIASTCRHGVS